jgi:hypothetical protein
VVQHIENVLDSAPTKLAQAVMVLSCFGRCLVRFSGVEVGVWCAVSVRQILGKYFFSRLNSDWYVSDMLNFFFNQLAAKE